MQPTTIHGQRFSFLITPLANGSTLISRMGPSGRPVRVTTLSDAAWEMTLDAIVGDGSPPKEWPGATVFKQFADAWLATGSEDDFIELDSNDLLPCRRRFSAHERAEIERSLRVCLDDGVKVSAWLRANPGRLSRSAAYRWVQEMRSREGVECDDGGIPDEPFLRVISGGRG